MSKGQKQKEPQKELLVKGKNRGREKTLKTPQTSFLLFDPT
jgi:hypothetical protein